MPLWYLAASLIVLAIFLALASVTSLLLIFCSRLRIHPPMACDLGYLWISAVVQWLRLRFTCSCCQNSSDNSYHTVCIDNGDDFSDECSSGCCDSSNPDSQCLSNAANPG